MLRVVHGNRFEELADALIGELPAADPFAPTTIVVPRAVVATWLTYRIAEARGIASGLELPFLDRFLADTYIDAAATAAGLSALRRDQLAAAIASVLADGAALGDPALARVRDYLGDPARPDAAARRVQLAQRVAGLYWGYAMTRPEWLAAWDAGRAIALPERANADDARWQAHLWTAVAARLAASGHGGATLVPRLPLVRRLRELPPPRLPRPVHVVGFSYLAPAYLGALAELGGAGDVIIYLVDPCAEFWEDVRDPRRRGRLRSRGAPPPADAVAAPGPADRVLGLWGVPIRDTAAALTELTGGALDGRFIEPTADTALDRLLADVLVRADAPAAASPAADAGDAEGGASVRSTGRPGLPAGASGVTVLACPSVRRELEIAGAEIVRLLGAHPDLRAHEIAVLVAGDPDEHLALLPAVWGGLLGEAGAGLPFHVVDSHLASSGGRVGEAVHALFELPLGRFTRRELLGLMTHPCVLARVAPYGHVDPADWVAWTERLGIVHGADGRDHRGTYLDGRDLFHWDQGILRLALGGFVSGDRPGAPAEPVGIGGRRLVPEEVASDRQASAATFALLARSLIGDARWLRDQALPLATWARVLDAAISTYIAAPDDGTARELERARGEITDLAELDLDGRAVGYREVVELARHRLGALLGDRGEPLAHGVTIAPLAPGRPLPFRYVFVLGLGEGRFPASDAASPLDLRDPPRAGEVSPRERDRVAFLDAALAARDRLVLSYVAVEPRSGEPIAPASVVIELADALAPYLGAVASSDALARITVAHPLHRWDPAYDTDALAPSPVPARARERRAVRVRDAIATHLRGRGVAQPDAARLRELLAAGGSPALAQLARDLRITPLAAPETGATDDAPVQISLATIRRFVEAPIQAWASAVLGLGELPDEELIDKSDEPFGHDPPARAAVLRDTLALVLGCGPDGPRPVDAAHAAVVDARERRGAAPVGVFGAIAAEGDRELVARWQAELAPRLAGAARRIAFGRSHAGDAELAPPIALAVELGGRTRRIELVGQTELLVELAEAGLASVVVAGADANRRHTLRGAIDHLALAAAGDTAREHVTLCLDRGGKVHETAHAAWTPDAARAFLATLVGELLAEPHGYVLSLDDAYHALVEKPIRQKEARGGNPGSLGYGPIQRRDRLGLPEDPLAIARRRLAPLVDRMSGDHKFTGGGA